MLFILTPNQSIDQLTLKQLKNKQYGFLQLEILGNLSTLDCLSISALDLNALIFVGFIYKNLRLYLV